VHARVIRAKAAGVLFKIWRKRKVISGFEEDTTNNKMELTAAIEALKCLKEPCSVELYSDSAYLVNGFLNYWVANWKKNGWRTAGKDEVKTLICGRNWTGLTEFMT
jgi:ribonuclease HI